MKNKEKVISIEADNTKMDRVFCEEKLIIEMERDNKGGGDGGKPKTAEEVVKKAPVGMLYTGYSRCYRNYSYRREYQRAERYKKKTV